MNHQDELPLAKVSEVDEAKRQWLQGMRHPVDTVTEPEPAEILAEFIRQHSAAGQLVARAVFLSPPYLVAEEELSVLLESIKQNGDYADIACFVDVFANEIHSHAGAHGSDIVRAQKLDHFFQRRKDILTSHDDFRMRAADVIRHLPGVF